MTPFQKKQLDLMRRMESLASLDTPVATIVPMQTDYINDPGSCLTCVTFLPPRLTEIIQMRLIEPLAHLEPNFYYYPGESMHITVHNIRVCHDPPNFGQAEIRLSRKLLGTALSHCQSFDFKLSGALHMPTSAAVIALIDPAYDHLVKNLRIIFTRAGLPDDKKYFADEVIFANTTFCRFTHQPSQTFVNELRRHQSDEFGSMTATEVVLIRTNAGCYPTKTEILGRYQLQ